MTALNENKQQKLNEIAKLVEIGKTGEADRLIETEKLKALWGIQRELEELVDLREMLGEGDEELAGFDDLQMPDEE
ncbi:MAG: hypothetical protein ABEI54_03910 [Candidatus Bipolaricaulia bacterium]